MNSKPYNSRIERVAKSICSLLLLFLLSSCQSNVQHRSELTKTKISMYPTTERSIWLKNIVDEICNSSLDSKEQIFKLFSLKKFPYNEEIISVNRKRIIYEIAINKVSRIWFLLYGDNTAKTWTSISTMQDGCTSPEQAMSYFPEELASAKLGNAHGSLIVYEYSRPACTITLNFNVNTCLSSIDILH